MIHRFSPAKRTYRFRFPYGDLGELHTVVQRLGRRTGRMADFFTGPYAQEDVLGLFCHAGRLRGCLWACDQEQTEVRFTDGSTLDDWTDCRITVEDKGLDTMGKAAYMITIAVPTEARY